MTKSVVVFKAERTHQRPSMFGRPNVYSLSRAQSSSRWVLVIGTVLLLILLPSSTATATTASLSSVHTKKKNRHSHHGFLQDVIRPIQEQLDEWSDQRYRQQQQQALRDRMDADLQSMLMAKARPLDEFRDQLEAHGYRLVPKNNNQEDEYQGADDGVGRRHLEDGKQEDEEDEQDQKEGEDEEGDDDDFYINYNSLYSFSGYSMKYAQCQTIQKFSEDAIKNGEYNAMVTDDVVILRLCPRNSCNSNKQYGCHYNYAEYAIGLTDYMTIMIHYSMEKEKALCTFCEKCANGDYDDDQQQRERRRKLEDAAADEDANFDDDDYYADEGGGDDDNGAANNNNDDDDDDDGGANNNQNSFESWCSNYEEKCYDLINDGRCNFDDDGNRQQENNGDDDSLWYEEYLDYFQCVKIESQNDDQYYWVRPRCDYSSSSSYSSSSAATIKMALFYDPYCSQYAGNEVNLREFSGINFNNTLFEEYYSGECIDCADNNYPPWPYYDLNSYLCNKVHYSSARCTSNMGFDLFDDDDNNNHKVECSFIESVRFGTYNQKGEIYIDASQYGELVKAEVTDGQKWGLAISILLCVGLGVYSCYLHHSITNLLIKSLSHSHLLPPGRHKSRSKSSSHRRSTKGNSSSSSRRSHRGGSDRDRRSGGEETETEDDDWDHGAGRLT